MVHLSKRKIPIIKFASNITISKTRIYNIDPLKPHFYIVKLGFTGVYIIFLISAQKHRLWVLVRTASSRLYVLSRNMENIRFFSSENIHLLTQKLLSQGYQKTKLVATLKKFYGRHHDLVNPYNVAVSRIVSDVFASDAP